MTVLNRSEVSNILQDVFREVFGDPSIVLSDSTSASDIEGWDSLQQIKIILSCEKHFGIRLRARDINALENVGQMIDHLIAAINKSPKR